MEEVYLPENALEGCWGSIFPALQHLSTTLSGSRYVGNTQAVLHVLMGHPALQELILGWVWHAIPWPPVLQSMPRLQRVELMPVVKRCRDLLADIAAARGITSIKLCADEASTLASIRSRLAQHAPSRLLLQQVAGRLQVLDLCDSRVYLGGSYLVGLLRALPALRKLRAIFDACDVKGVDCAVRQVCGQQVLLVMGGQEGTILLYDNIE